MPLVKVYPRAYGGTLHRFGAQAPGVGLSPRVRGNLLDPKSVCNRIGSIPARTGEPVLPKPMLASLSVYPRAYGGTSVIAQTRASMRGLSPRVRGNPAESNPRISNKRSIPARTGEPNIFQGRDRGDGVYPRAYGGTDPRNGPRPHRRGLSPRVRGNPSVALRFQCPRRSIPARTGEPRQKNLCGYVVAVYPRAYGGTALRNEPI